MVLSFVFAESALELVPREIARSTEVVADARRREREPTEVLLDRSFHQGAMQKLKDSEKRGRPDLVHVALLGVTGTPLYLEGRVKVFVHTWPDVVVELAERTRIPKNYLRFRGLMEKALAGSEDGLVEAYPASMSTLLRDRLRPSLTMGFSVQGGMRDLVEVGKELAGEKDPCVVVGGFPHGHFSRHTLELLDSLVRVDERPLEAHVVSARLVYEVERAGKSPTIKSRQ